MPTSGADLLRELSKRTDGKWTLEQLVRQLNQALAQMGALGSFPWDQITELAQTPVGGVLYFSLDLGKKIAVFNSSNQTAVNRVSAGDAPASSAGYVSVGSGNWNTFAVIVSPTTLLPGIKLYGAGTTVDVYYHAPPPTLNNTTSSSVRWTLPQLDDLLLDYATLIVSDLLKQQVMPDFRASVAQRLAEFGSTYTTERQNTGRPQEVVEAIQEKNQVGRP